MGVIYLPTKNNLIKLRNTIKQHKNGQKLLEEKSLILKRKLEDYRQKQNEIRNHLTQAIEDAENTLKKAVVDVGFDELMDISNAIVYDNTINIKYLSLMGIEIPSLKTEKLETDLNYGLYHTTSNVDESILKFLKVKEEIIRLSEIDNIIIRLKKAIEKIERRSNALKEIIIPRDEQLASQISSTLEEAERDEFIRLKVVKNRNI